MVKTQRIRTVRTQYTKAKQKRARAKTVHAHVAQVIPKIIGIPTIPDPYLVTLVGFRWCRLSPQETKKLIEKPA